MTFEEIRQKLVELGFTRGGAPPRGLAETREALESVRAQVSQEGPSSRSERVIELLSELVEVEERHERLLELADDTSRVENCEDRPGGGHETERTLNPALARRQPELSAALRGIDRHSDSFRHQRDAERLEHHLRHEDVGSFDAR